MKKLKNRNLYVLIPVFFVLSNFLFASSRGLDSISDGQWLQLTIQKEGVYTITAADLAAKGITIPVDKIATIKIYGQSGKVMDSKEKTDLSMNEQEILVNTNPDGSLNNIIFYASAATGFEYNTVINRQKHYINYYDKNNYYLLTFGKTFGKRAMATSPPIGEVINKPTSYRASIYFEEDKFMLNEPGSGILWVGNLISNNVPITNQLPNFNGEGNIEYLLSVAHNASTSQSFRIYEGGTLLENTSIGGISGDHKAAVIKTINIIKPADQYIIDGRSVLKFEYSGSPMNPYYNFYEIHYRSDLKPIDNEIILFSDIAEVSNNNGEITEYSINNFINKDIYGYDVTDMSNPKLLTNIANTGGFFIFRANEKKNDIKKYIISAKTITPIIDNISMLNLRSTLDSEKANVDVIVITPDEFIESAKSYAEYRSKQSNYKVSVIPISNIYNEFSYGRLDVIAVRDYIQYCNEKWTNKPQYIVLWGAGTFDFRGIEGNPNYIPAYQNPVPAEESIGNETIIQANLSQYSTDDIFVMISGNDNIPDIPIGRIPISSNKQGYDYIAKLDNYENNSDIGNWRRNILLTADDGPTTANNAGEGTMHVGNSESTAEKIKDDFLLNKVYIVGYPVEYQTGGARRIPKANEEILNQINTVGASAFVFTGHGNTNMLSHERVFTRDMLQQLTNVGKLFFFVAGSCEVGRYDNKNSTMGADIVLLPNTGAIASFSATRVSFSGANTDLLNDVWYNATHKDSITNQHRTLGEVIKLAKSKLNINNVRTAESHMYVLLGDPTIKLVFPELDIKIDEINEIPVTDNNTISVKAMTILKLKGRIISPQYDSTQTDFTGNINIQLNEPIYENKVIDDYGTNFTYKVNGATLNNSSYKVENGEFEAEFIIPADISFSEGNSLIYLYATSDDNRFAKGINKNISIDDISTNLARENNPPIITIKLDHEFFKDGDTVSITPLLLVDLWDETGINATGLGVGHKIEAFIDDNTTPIDLTSSYNSSLTDYRAGYIYKTLYGIAEGEHTITIKAWDVFNNKNIVTARFVIPSTKEEEIRFITFSPNPANTTNSDTKITIYYNLIPPIDATITIFDMQGNEIDNFDAILTSPGYSLIDWNYTNKSTLSPGTYYYRINYKYNKTKTTYSEGTKFGAIGVINK